MKITSYIFALLIITSCNSQFKESKSIISENNVTSSTSKKKQPFRKITDHRLYLSGSSLINYDYKTELKNGYLLDYRVFIASNSLDTFQVIYLMKDSIDIIEISGSTYGLLFKNLGYVGADFDRVFVFIQSYGSGNPHYISLIDKKTGEQLRKGTWVDANEKEQILLYIENGYKGSEKLVLYDLKNDKEFIINEFKESDCVQNNTGGLRNCVEIDSVTEKIISLKVETNKETIIKKYYR